MDGLYYPGIRSQWISANEILFSTSTAPKYEIQTFYRRNLKTGQQQKLPELSKTLQAFQANPPDYYVVSPDGKWLLTPTWQNHYLLAEINGKRHQDFPSLHIEAPRFLLWMQDSRHWLESYVVGNAHKLFLRDVENPQSVQELPLAGDNRLLSYLARVISLQKAISIVPPEAEEAKSPVPPAVKVCILSLEARGKVLQEYRIPVPKRSQHNSYYVSPQGDKIAWEIVTLSSDRMGEWLQKYLPFLKVQPHNLKRTELWVCNLDGTDMHEIGCLPHPKDQEVEAFLPGRLSPDFWSIVWLPDGKQLSFEYEDKLYTVPVD